MSLKNRAINTINLVSHRLNGKTEVGLWDRYSHDALLQTCWFDFSGSDVEKSLRVMAQYPGSLDIRHVTWFIPDFDNPFWGGIHTIFRFAAYMAEHKGVVNCFVVLGDIPREKIYDSMCQAFPALKNSEVRILRSVKELDTLHETDVSICTLWTTAYQSLKFNKTKRKFYFIQDYEPLFYPAGSTYAQAEETYRFGFYGLCNTVSLKKIYEEQYGGQGQFFTPCVNLSVFHKADRVKPDSEPYLVYFYARPGHPRNGFELGISALKLLKSRMKDRVRIVTAGSTWNPENMGLAGIVENLGLLSYEETAKLYRRCDAALIMMFTRHPSYTPFELMASGCLVVTNLNNANTWYLRDRENCLLSRASATSLCDTLIEGLSDSSLREKMIHCAWNDINTKYNNWDSEMENIYKYVCDPENTDKDL